MKRNILTALMVSFAVAIPLAFASMTVASGDLSEIIKHPHFWAFYVKSFFWLFAVGFAASALTVVLISKRSLDSCETE